MLHLLYPTASLIVQLILKENNMSENSFDFEKSLNELEKIVSALEDNEISLDEAIKLFEKGIELSNKCRQTLEKAEIKITALTNKE